MRNTKHGIRRRRPPPVIIQAPPVSPEAGETEAQKEATRRARRRRPGFRSLISAGLLQPAEREGVTRRTLIGGG